LNIAPKFSSVLLHIINLVLKTSQLLPLSLYMIAPQRTLLLHLETLMALILQHIFASNQLVSQLTVHFSFVLNAEL
jgi:hypothetical protein